jgi:hypothetical protein
MSGIGKSKGGDVTKRLPCAIDDYNAASPGVDCDAASKIGDPQTCLKLN